MNGPPASAKVKKVRLLDELMTSEERSALIRRPASLARTLTASLEVIERLRSVPPRSNGRPRAIAGILFMPKRQWEQCQQAKPVPSVE